MTTPAKHTFSPVPKDGEEFELTLNGDEVDPLEMVRKDGLPHPEKWKFEGPRVAGKLTGRFKLIHIFGGCPDHLDDVAIKIAQGWEGGWKLAEGQWREAFKERYPHHDQRATEPIYFGGSKWIAPTRGTHALPEAFPCLFISEGETLSEVWGSGFHWTGGGYTSFSALTRWLVKKV